MSTSSTAAPGRGQRGGASRRSERIAESDVHKHLNDVERWFIRRGLPHFIEDYRATEDVFYRALPLVVFLLLVQMGLELTSRTVTWKHRLEGGGIGLGAVIVLFLVANAIRQPHRLFKTPRKVGVVEMAILVALGPAVGLAVRARPQAVALDLAANIGVLALIYALTAYAVLPVVLWALRHSVSELGNLVNLASKALPMLALFGTFLFLNVDMWHIAANLERHQLWEVVGFFAVIIFLFLLVRLPDEVSKLAGGYTLESVSSAAHDTPLVNHLDEIDGELAPLATSRRQRLNMLFVLGFTQIIQVLLLSLVVFVYFIILGKLAVTKEQMGDWLHLSETGDTAGRYEILINTPGRLFGFPAKIPGTDVIFPQALLQTAILITTFSAFFFAVSAVTDEAYRKDFFESITGKLTKSLDIRCGYVYLYVKALKNAEMASLRNRDGGREYDPRAIAEDHARTRHVPVWTGGDPNSPTVHVPRPTQPQPGEQASVFTQPPYPAQGLDQAAQSGFAPQFQPSSRQLPVRQPGQQSQQVQPGQVSQHPDHDLDDPFKRWPQQQQ